MSDARRPRLIAEHEVHHVMAALRDDVADPAEHVVVGVQDEVAGLQPEADVNPGLLQIAVSTIVQTTNLLISMLAGRSPVNKDTHDGD